MSFQPQSSVEALEDVELEGILQDGAPVVIPKGSKLVVLADKGEYFTFVHTFIVNKIIRQYPFGLYKQLFKSEESK